MKTLKLFIKTSFFNKIDDFLCDLDGFMKPLNHTSEGKYETTYD